MSKNPNSRGTGRTRNFATVVYPDSQNTPADWLDILQLEVVPCFVSPFHDSDINPGGEPKKPHYHVMIMFDSVKTLEQAKEIFDKIGGVGCEVIKSIRAYARYLCHLDNPDKVQYNPEHVLSFGGSNYKKICDLIVDRNLVLSEIMSFIDEHDEVWSFAQIARYASDYRPDWHEILTTSGTYFISEYIKSVSWEATHGYEFTNVVKRFRLPPVSAPTLDNKADE